MNKHHVVESYPNLFETCIIYFREFPFHPKCRGVVSKRSNEENTESNYDQHQDTINRDLTQVRFKNFYQDFTTLF